MSVRSSFAIEGSHDEWLPKARAAGGRSRWRDVRAADLTYELRGTVGIVPTPVQFHVTLLSEERGRTRCAATAMRGPGRPRAAKAIAKFKRELER